jgi:hypothetical protein
MEFHECYAPTYASARKKFLAAARATGARLHAYPHPIAGAAEPLFVDVACFGKADAPRRMLAISGTHGLEGFCGSAIQLAWMQGGGPAELPADTAVVMVHAINPWGFANLSRTTENNVDLNRNFIDFSQPPPRNPGYGQLHAQLLPAQWSTASMEAAQRAMDEYESRHGPDALFDSVARGQYEYADGLNYGGQAREWSNLITEKIAHEHLAGARKVGFIDWHTGIGEYGEPFFLCFHEAGSALREQALRWWGAERIEGAQPHGRARPNYQGLLCFGLQRFLGDTPMCGAVIEFGTRGWHMRRMLRLDLWLKFHASPETERYAMHRADLLDSFCPVDQVWRDSTLRHGRRIMDQAVHGLANWNDA